MASFIQNYVGGMVQNAAMGAATYAITTGGRVVGDVVIGAGDLIEGAGRNVGNSVEGYIDRYGNWIRSYGDGAIAATAASSGGPNAYRTAVKPGGAGAGGATKQKAIGGPNKPGTKALPAPSAKRPGMPRSASDMYTPPAQAKALPASGVKKALPAAAGAAGKGGVEMSKGQLAKARGVKAEDLKKGAGGAVGGAGDAAKKAVPGGLLGAKDVGVASKPGRNKRPAGRDRKPAYAAGPAAAGSEAGGEQRKTPRAAVVGGNGVPTSRTPAGAGAGQKQEGPKPYSSAKRPDGKVVVAKESKPKPAAGRTKATGDGPKPKDEKGGMDFMRLMAEEPKKKGPGSVAGSVRSNKTAKKASGGGGGGGDGKQDTSAKYDFF